MHLRVLWQKVAIIVNNISIMETKVTVTVKIEILGYFFLKSIKWGRRYLRWKAVKGLGEDWEQEIGKYIVHTHEILKDLQIILY